MAYIGRQLARGENKLFDDISSSFNGSTTVFNLTVASVATSTATPFQLFVSLGGVMQKPNTDFTTAGNQITFTTAPAAGLSCWIMMQGDTVDQAAIPDSSVTPSKIAGSGDFAFPADVRLKDADGSNYVGFKAPATVGSNLVWTLPATDGSANQFLQTNASGVLGWGTADVSSAMPLSGGTFTGDVSFASNSISNAVNWSKAANIFQVRDATKLTFGNSNDLQLFHDSSNSYIKEAGTGQLHIQADNLILENAAGANYLVGISGGETIIYHNDSAKLTTASTGVSITGALTVSTNATITGNLTVSGTTTTINTQTLDVEDKNVVIGKVSSPSDTTADGGGWTLKGSTDKTWNWVNSTDAWTSSEHVNLLDSKKLLLGTDSDLEVYHSGTQGWIVNKTGALRIFSNPTNEAINVAAAGAVSISHGNAVKLATTSGGINVTGAIQVNGAALASGNTVDLVADGAIAAGKPVIITTAGKAAELKQALTGQPLDTGIFYTNVTTVVSTNNAVNAVGCYDVNADKYLSWWVNADDNSKPKLTIYRITGGNDTLTQSTFDMSPGTGATGLENSTSREGAMCFDASTNNIIGVYGHQLTSGTYPGKCWTGTTTTGATNSFTVGYCREFESGNCEHFSIVYNPDAQKSLVCYSDKSDSGKGKCNVITSSGSGGSADISFGGTGEFLGSNINSSSVIYDTQNDKFVVFYTGQSNYVYAKIGTISGTTVSWSSQTTIEGNGSAQVKAVYTTGGTIYVQYGRGSLLEARVVTSNGSTLTVGNAVTVQNYYDEFHKVKYDATNAAVLSAHKTGTGSASMDYQKISISGTTPTLRGTTSLSSGAMIQRVIGDFKDGKMPLLYRTSDAGSNYLIIRVYRTSTISSNATSKNGLGFAPLAISDGNTGTINLPGNVVGNQSGLTAGQRYFIQSDGTLGTSQDNTIGAASGNTKAGVALSATSLLIADYRS